MSRTALLISFLGFVVLAFYSFLSRDPSASLSKVPSDSPYLKLREYRYSRYINDAPIRHLEGTLAVLSRVDRVDLMEGVRGWRYNNPQERKKDEIQSDHVIAMLNSSRLEDFQKPVTVKEAIIGGGVEIRRDQVIIETEEARYLGGDRNLLVGNLPMRARLRNQFVDSDRGFILNLKEEKIELLGPVKGVVFPNEK